MILFLHDSDQRKVGFDSGDSHRSIKAMAFTYITPAIKAKLRLKNKLLRQGKMEKANALSVSIGHAIAKKKFN